MFKKFIKNTLKCSVLPFSDILIGPGPHSDRLPIVDEDSNSTETGLDRLKQMFQADEFGNISLEANTVFQVSCMSLFIGGLYGGIINSRSAYQDFMRNNEATSFKSHLDAKRKLQDKVTLAFGKGAYKWGTRLTFFTTTFIGTATMIQVYRGKSGISEYVIAGGLSGFVYKFPMGPRGWIVGSGLGMVLGLICGATTNALLALSGLSIDEARQYQNVLPNYRKEWMKTGMKQYMEKEDYAILKARDETIGTEGEHIDNIDKGTSKK